jgi:hypothetical protein
MANERIKAYARARGVFLWELAKQLGLQDSNFSRLMRNELPPEKLAELKEIVDSISRQRSGDL